MYSASDSPPAQRHGRGLPGDRPFPDPQDPRGPGHQVLSGAIGHATMPSTSPYAAEFVKTQCPREESNLRTRFSDACPWRPTHERMKMMRRSVDVGTPWGGEPVVEWDAGASGTLNCCR